MNGFYAIGRFTDDTKLTVFYHWRCDNCNTEEMFIENCKGNHFVPLAILNDSILNEAFPGEGGENDFFVCAELKRMMYNCSAYKELLENIECILDNAEASKINEESST